MRCTHPNASATNLRPSLRVTARHWALRYAARTDVGAMGGSVIHSLGSWQRTCGDEKAFIAFRCSSTSSTAAYAVAVTALATRLASSMSQLASITGPSSVGWRTRAWPWSQRENQHQMENYHKRQDALNDPFSLYPAPPFPNSRGRRPASRARWSPHRITVSKLPWLRQAPRSQGARHRRRFRDRPCSGYRLCPRGGRCRYRLPSGGGGGRQGSDPSDRSRRPQGGRAAGRYQGGGMVPGTRRQDSPRSLAVSISRSTVPAWRL